MLAAKPPHPSPPLLWLFQKELRELTATKSFWVLLLAMGPLTGLSFLSSVRTYSEVSGLNGGSAGVGEALSPLIGIWAPTFSACELAAVFLLPFVAISLVAGDRQSGALLLEMQQPLGPVVRISIKALVLLLGWLIAMLPPFSAILLWISFGGTVYPPELATLTLGHILNAGLTISLAFATASLTQHHSTAAILTLGVTVGTWIISFFGAIQGGLWELAARFTPAAMVSAFQHGLTTLSAVLIAIALILTGLCLAAIWLRLGIALRTRIFESAGLALLTSALIAAATFATPSWDTSENRANSFPPADQKALTGIHQPLTIEVHLAPEDPRRMELEHRALSKLKRILPGLQVRYISATSIGLFEQANPGYGEIWYDLAGKRLMSRTTSAEGVLESIYSLAHIPAPVDMETDIFRGHPLATTAPGAAIVFYLVWPTAFLAIALISKRKLT